MPTGTTEIVKSLQNLARFANGFIPSRVTGALAIEDAHDFQSDLLLFARAVDPVLETYGRYLAAHGVIEQSALPHFRDVLQRALDDEALYAIDGVRRRVCARVCA